MTRLTVEEAQLDFDYNAFEKDVHIIHNVLRRCMETIKKEAMVVSAADLELFLGFVGAFAFFLNAHHHHEDDFVFPLFAKYGYDTSKLDSEHKSIHGLIECLQIIANKVLPAEYDGPKLVETIEKLQDCLLPHLLIEEELSMIKNTVPMGITKDDIIQCNNAIMDANKEYDPTLVLPLVRLN